MKLPQLSLQLGNLRIFDVICSQKTCVKKRGNLLGKSEETYKEKARKPARKKRGNLLGKSEETYKEKANIPTRAKSEETYTLLRSEYFRRRLRNRCPFSAAFSCCFLTNPLSLSRVKFMPQKFSYKFPLGLIKKIRSPILLPFSVCCKVYIDYKFKIFSVEYD
jgi:hypothetical protein